MHPAIRSQDLLIHEIGDEFVIYHRRQRRAHRLNPTVSAVWRHLDGATSPEAIARSMECDVSVVQHALHELASAHLISGAPLPPVSRRTAVRKVAAVAAVGIALPVISSIPAPTAAAAQSGVVCAASAGTSGTTAGSTASATSQNNAGTSGSTPCGSTLIERDGVYYEVSKTPSTDA